MDVKVGDTFIADFYPAGYEDVRVVYKDITIKVVSVEKDHWEWVTEDIGEEVLSGGVVYVEDGPTEFENIRR